MNATSSSKPAPVDFKAAAQYIAQINIARDRLADAHRLLSSALGQCEHEHCDNPRSETCVAKAICRAEALATDATDAIRRCAVFAAQLGGAS